MGRRKGSITTPDTAEMALEIEKLWGSKQKYNVDIFRLIEILMSYRVAEAICSHSEDEPIGDIKTEVEIPFIGTISISPRVFHEKHRLTDEPSIHLDFEFTPNNGFKSDVLRAYRQRESDLCDIFANLYSDRLTEIYNRIQREG